MASTKEKITATALALFAQRGYDGVSVRDICKQVGIKESSLYYHFPSKQAILTTLLSHSTTVSVDALLAAEPDAPDETAVVWTHTGPCAALTIDGADHSALLK